MVVIDAENPHVFDSYYYANLTQQSFQQTSHFQFHSINNGIAAFLGFTNALVLLYLVVFKTPMRFQAFKWMLLLSALSDLYFTFGNFWCQLRLRIVGGTMLFNTNGPSSYFPYKLQCYSLLLEATGQPLAYSMLPLQYHYRYTAIKKNSPPSTRQTIVYILICLSMSSICAFTESRAMCQFDNSQRIDYGRLWFAETPIPKLIIGDQSYLPMFIHNTYFTCICLVSYLLSLWYAWKTMKVLKDQTMFLTARTKLIQKQFNRMLMAQSILTFAVSIFPTMLATVLILLNAGTEYIGEYIVLSITWYPCLNSLCTLAFVKPYTDACKQFFFPCCKRKVSTVDVSSNAAPSNAVPIDS